MPLKPSLTKLTGIHVYMYVSVYVYMFIHVYIYDIYICMCKLWHTTQLITNEINRSVFYSYLYMHIYIFLAVWYAQTNIMIHLIKFIIIRVRDEIANLYIAATHVSSGSNEPDVFTGER
jgi:hypothetical protein